MRVHNRVEAGRQLATKLSVYAGRSDVLVLGLTWFRWRRRGLV